MNRVWREGMGSTILRSMSDGGGGGNFRLLDTPLDQIGDDQNQQRQPTNRSRNNSGRNQNQADENISLDDDADPLNSLFNEEDEDSLEGDEDEELDESGKPKPKKKKSGTNADDSEDEDENESPGAAAARQLQEQITNFRLPDDLIPEDFDPTDRTQLGKLLVSTQQHSIKQTLGLAFGIMNRALQAQKTELQADFDTRLGNWNQANRTEAMLATQIPEYEDPALKPVVKTLYEQAKKRHSKTADAIAATKSALKALGGRLSGNPADRGEGAPRPGNRGRGPNATGIDSFFDMPGNPAQNRMMRDR